MSLLAVLTWVWTELVLVVKNDEKLLLLVVVLVLDVVFVDIFSSFYVNRKYAPPFRLQYTHDEIRKYRLFDCHNDSGA